MEKSEYIRRLHCHNSVLAKLVKESLRVEGYSAKKDLVKRVRKMQSEITSDRFDYYKSLHPLGMDIWYEMYLDFYRWIVDLCISIKSKES